MGGVYKQDLRDADFIRHRVSIMEVSFWERLKGDPKAFLVDGSKRLEEAGGMPKTGTGRCLKLEKAAVSLFTAAEKANSKLSTAEGTEKQRLREIFYFSLGQLAAALQSLGEGLKLLNRDGMRGYVGMMRTNDSFEDALFGSKYELLPSTAVAGFYGVVPVPAYVPDSKLKKFVSGRAECCLEYAKKLDQRIPSEKKKAFEP